MSCWRIVLRAVKVLTFVTHVEKEIILKAYRTFLICQFFMLWHDKKTDSKGGKLKFKCEEKTWFTVWNPKYQFVVGKIYTMHTRAMLFAFSALIDFFPLSFVQYARLPVDMFYLNLCHIYTPTHTNSQSSLHMYTQHVPSELYTGFSNGGTLNKKRENAIHYRQKQHQSKPVMWVSTSKQTGTWINR